MALLPRALISALLALLTLSGSAGAAPVRLPVPPGAVGPDCGLAAPTPPAWVIPGFLRLGEEYLVRALPSLDCPACPVGLAPDVLVLQLAADTPCRMDLEILVRELVGEDGDRRPGRVRCRQVLSAVDMDAGTPRLLRLALDCPCLGVQRDYALGFRILSCSEAPPDLITGEEGIAGTAWVGENEVFGDAVEDYGLPGAFSLHAEAACCDEETPAARVGWGPWKAWWGGRP